MGTTRVFNLLNSISSGYIDEVDWGMINDTSTKTMFGSIEDADIEGEYVYVYRNIDNLLEKEIQPDLKVTISKEYGNDLCVLLYKLDK